MAAELTPQDLVDKLLERGKKLAGAELFVRVIGTHTANARFAVNRLTTAGQADDMVIEVSVGYGRRKASVTFNQTDPGSLDEGLQRASRLARLAPEDPEHMPVLAAQKYVTPAPGFDAATAELDAGARADAVKATIAAAEAAGVVIAGFLNHGVTSTAIGSSAGLRGSHRETRARVSMTARTPDGSGSGWSGLATTRFADLGVAALAKNAVDKALASRNPRRLEAGRYVVILEPAAVIALTNSLVEALNARPAEEGRSALSRPGGGTKLGEKLLADWLSLRSDPADPATPDAPFDRDGLPRGRTDWIAAGKVAALHVTRFWGKKTGKPPIANSGRYQLTGGAAASREELIKGIDRGVLITRFWYIRDLDPRELVLTGLTRDGTFLIEKGEIVAPVNNFRWNESPLVAFGNAEAATRDGVFPPGELGEDRPRVPAVRTHGFNLASISEAV